MRTRRANFHPASSTAVVVAAAVTRGMVFRVLGLSLIAVFRVSGALIVRSPRHSAGIRRGMPSSLSSSSSSLCARQKRGGRTVVEFQGGGEGGGDCWKPLNPESLVSAKCLIEQTLCQADADGNQPRMAKDVDYAAAVLDAWKQQEQDAYDEHGKIWDAETCRITYYDDDDDGGGNRSGSEVTKLYGHVVRKPLPPTKKKIGSGDDDDDNEDDDNKKIIERKVPGIVLFHTGAGPHDIFLLWKAAALINAVDTATGESIWKTNEGGAEGESDEGGGGGGDSSCVILIADILSDDVGWGWDTDRTRYNEVRRRVLDDVRPRRRGGGTGSARDKFRPELRKRIRSALNALTSVKFATSNEGDGGTTTTAAVTVDPHRVGALGWCLGGYAAMELSKMRSDGGGLGLPALRAMVTFHGVFGDDDDDGVDVKSDGDAGKDDGEEQEDRKLERLEVLICNGVDDPFVTDRSLENALGTLQGQENVVTSLLQLRDAKHGFTNPAQDFNPSDAFRYNDDAANKSWKQTLAVLERNLSR